MLFGDVPEVRGPPHRVTTEEILEWIEEKIDYDLDGGRANVPTDPYKKYGVKRKSIFFDLPYWKELKIRHVIDVMHTEKNVCENLLKTIMGVKHTVGVRADLEARHMRPELW
ncbi:hypothetical protein R1sor_003366 [Riccia sorocarpa]|uniref:Uncharacterized protein n=1 Tax=Riccia sorocarpa TaxID=122646 RepID=A0ABD3H5B2_9MARC